jgi:hypothetical protein
MLPAVDDQPRQNDLFAAMAPTQKKHQKESQLDRTLDELDAKFGKGMVHHAHTVLPKEMTPGRLGPPERDS